MPGIVAPVDRTQYINIVEGSDNDIISLRYSTNPTIKSKVNFPLFELSIAHDPSYKLIIIGVDDTILVEDSLMDFKHDVINFVYKSTVDYNVAALDARIHNAYVIDLSAIRDSIDGVMVKSITLKGAINEVLLPIPFNSLFSVAGDLEVARDNDCFFTVEHQKNLNSIIDDCVIDYYYPAVRDAYAKWSSKTEAYTDLKLREINLKRQLDGRELIPEDINETVYNQLLTEAIHRLGSINADEDTVDYNEMASKAQKLQLERLNEYETNVQNGV